MFSSLQVLHILLFLILISCLVSAYFFCICCFVPLVFVVFLLHLFGFSSLLFVLSF
jgi:hypothetical protein